MVPPYLLLGCFFWKHLETSQAACSGLMHFAARISKTPNSAPAVRPRKALRQLQCSTGGGYRAVKTQVVGERTEGF